MANAVITKYLSDTTIPAETRRNIAKGLNSGDLTETAAVSGITAKYGSKYGDSIAPTGSGPTKGEVATNVAKTLTKAVNPANWSGIAEDVANAAPAIGKTIANAESSGALGSKITDEQVAQREAQNAANTDKKIAATKELNKKGIVPPSIVGSGVEERVSTPEDVVTMNKTVEQSSPLGIIGAQGNEAMEGLKQAGGGVLKIGQGLIDPASNKGQEGITDVAEGITRTAASPISGAINSIPDSLTGQGDDTGKKVKEFMGAVGSIPAETAGGIAYQLAKFINPSLSEDQLQEGIVRPIKAATNLGIIAKPEILEKGAAKVGEVAGNAIKKVTGATKNLADSGLSMASGLSKDTLDIARRSPEALTEGQKVGREVTRENALNMIKNPIDKKIADLSENGRAYEPIRKGTQTIKTPENYLGNKLKSAGLEVDSNGKISATSQSSVRTKGEVAKIQEIYDLYNKPNLTAAEFLNMREDLANLAKYESGKSTQLQDFAKGLRKEANTDLRGQINGLEALDNNYTKTVTELKKVRDIIYDKKGNLRDDAIQKVNNLLNKGKEGKLAKIEEAIPDFNMKKFVEQIKVTKALEDIEYAKGQKVGAYTHNIITSGAALTGNIPVAIGSVLTHPSVIIPILKAYAKVTGKSAEFASKLGSKILKGIRPADAEAVFVRDALKKMKPEAIKKLLTPKSTDKVENVSS